MKRLVLLAVALLVAPLAATGAPLPPSGDDHLVPEGSAYTYWGPSKDPVMAAEERDFDRKLHRVYSPMFAEQVVIRAFVDLPFDPSYAIALRRDGKVNTVVSMRIAKNRASFDRCDAPLDDRIAYKLVQAWTAVLLQTHYDPDYVQKTADGRKLRIVTATADGWTVHFAAGDGAGRAGVAGDPPADSPPGRLTSIADDLRDYCFRHDASVLAGMEAKTDALLTLLPHPLPEVLSIPSPTESPERSSP